MLTQSFTIAAAGIAAANAMLLPPEVTDARAPSLIDSLPFGAAVIHIQPEPLNVSCPGCPVPFKDGNGRIRLAEGIASHLEIQVKVGRKDDHDTLLINDFEVFPQPDPRHQILSAPHVADVTPEQEELSTLEPASTMLGYTLSWRRIETDPKDPAQLLAIDLQITEVVDHYSEASGADVMQLVDGIPNLHIKLVKDIAGSLRIAEIKKTESQTAHKNPLDRLENCTNLLCKWRAVIEAQLAKMRPRPSGCRKAMLNKLKSHHKSRPHPDPYPHPHPGAEDSKNTESAEDAGEHGHELPDVAKIHTHKWSVLFTKFAHHILLPILIGIAAGVSVSIVGMIIGTILVGLWRVFVRGQPFFHSRRRRSHSRSNRSNKASQKEGGAAVAEEKVALMETQELPPSYADEENQNTN